MVNSTLTEGATTTSLTCYNEGNWSAKNQELMSAVSLTYVM